MCWIGSDDGRWQWYGDSDGEDGITTAEAIVAVLLWCSLAAAAAVQRAGEEIAVKLRLGSVTCKIS